VKAWQQQEVVKWPLVIKVKHELEKKLREKTFFFFFLLQIQIQITASRRQINEKEKEGHKELVTQVYGQLGYRMLSSSNCVLIFYGLSLV
jgi:hypothetical protein